MRKQAQSFDFSGIAKDVVEAIGSRAEDLKSVKEHPFETAFRYLVPGWLLIRGHWLLALLMGASKSVLGIGPEDLGAMIDSALGFGSGAVPGQVSTSQLASLSSSLVDKILGGLVEKSSAFRYELASCGCFEISSLAVAWAAGPDRIEKFAVGVTRQSGLFRWLFQLPGTKSKGLLSGALFQVLKFLAIGLSTIVGFDVLGKRLKQVLPDTNSGAGLFSGPGSSGATTTTAPGMRLYTNPAGDVERAIVMMLDNLISDQSGKPFSRLFMDLKGHSPVGSPEMGRVLAKVRAAHGGASVREINGYRTFAAPPPADIARMLLPQATYNKQTQTATPAKPDVERELEGLFGGTK